MDVWLASTRCCLAVALLQVSTSLQTAQCMCLSNGLKCREMCKPQTCNNQADEEEAVVEVTDSDADAEEGL